MAQKGNIGVTTENIFPVIKKFLYSDHEIFLREMVSNAVDATQKLKTLAERGDFKGELGDLTVRVSLDTEKGTLTISDRGIGMTEEEINKYINQIAFSGVTDFLDKYKDNANAIIGHFGLGFYSSFMVSKKVDIITRSYKEGAKAVKWSCDGSPEFEIEDVEKTDRGSDIVLHIDDDCKEFLEKQKIEELLNKYCKFMAVPVAFGKKTEWKDGKQQETDEDNIINNNHEVVLSLVPKHGLAEEKEAKEAEQLAKYKATLSKEELEELVKQTKALKEYQDTPSSQKDLEKIPQLELKDITREPAKLYIDPKKIGGVDVIHHNMFTNGIAYIMMCYDCKNVPDELLPYIGLLSSVLGLMDTEKYTYTELTNEININCGGISTDAAIYTDNKDFDKCTIMYEVKGKVLYDNIQFVLDMMNEIIYKTKFSDYKRLKEIIAKLKSRMESTMTSAGHSTAMLAGMAQFSRNAYYSNEMRGYGFYELIQKLDSQFDELKEDISDKLSKLVDYIFHKENIIVSFTADDNGYDAFAPAFGKYAEELKKSDMPACERKYTPANVKTGYTSASQVQYVARCGNFRDGGYEYTGALRVLKVIFSYDYLWINVRVKGGAYGCMSGSYRNGDMYMVSYRDPNLRKTNDIYENAADYLEHFDVSDRDMVKFIIGTIGDIDTPMNPAAKGTRSFGAYICNTDYESLKKERGQVLDCNVERIRELAPLVRCAMDENYFCVVGSSKEINKESELFDKIQPLIKVQG